jgi:hypothetical protein
MSLYRVLANAAAAVLSLSLLACGGGGGGDASTPSGSLRLALTDAPACGYDAVNVTVQKIRVHRSSDASESDGGWSELELNPARRIDLLTLQNGVLAELGEMPLEPGHYQQMRLVLSEGASAGSMANSVVPSGQDERGLETPSALQTGLKMNVDLTVEADQRLDLVLDFDACKSVVRAGNSGRYQLKPVVRVIPRFVSGVSGVLSAAWPAAGTQVSLQQDGTVLRATAPAADGSFLLQPVAPGTYDLVFSAPGQATQVVTGVVVTSDTVTALNTAGSAIVPMPSASGSVEGTVSGSSVLADVRVLQALTGGPTIELASGPVDALTGEYAYTLPVAAPLVAPYVAAPGALVFTADAAAAGRYSVQAIAGSAAETVGPFTLTAGATETQDIVFP